MPTENERSSNVERAEVAGHIVECRVYGEREELWIDGRQHQFVCSRGHYNLYEDVYMDPKETLMAAACAFAQRLSDTNEA